MRRYETIMTDWSFTGPDGNTIQTDLPHTWNAIDGQDGGNDYYRGTCVYEKTLEKPDFDPITECLYLEFDGVNASAKVILNGREIMTHDNGYSTFRADVTEVLADQNQLRVEVDNSVNTRVYPQKADFTFYGGIYRDVKWLIANKQHFDLDYFGGNGLKASSKVNGDVATIEIEAFLQQSCANASVELSLFDAEENLVAQDVKPAEKTIKTELEVKNAHLWNGVKDPYLYVLKASLIEEEKILDQVSINYGIRTISVDPRKGFYLNGKLYPLRGVSRHQDRKGIGNAISYEMMEEDMGYIREVGANSIRLAHYQHNQYFYDLCDKYGMLVWAEIPYISAHMKDGNENTHFQMQELITQNYNHPCIVTWGLSNEITIDWKNSWGDCLKNHKSLNAFVKSLDQTRPTSMACYAMCTPFHPVTMISDLIAWNLYLGWYVPGLFLNDLFLGFFHLIRPRKALGYSEYGAEGMPNLHSPRPHRGDHTEEYQAKYHEFMLECFDRHKWMWSTYVWNMFDFAADARNQGGEPGMNHKGLMTFDRKIKKDSFYIYKAWWSEEPFVHICSKRYEYRTGDTLKVKVYSNQEQVTLFVNGKEAGSKTGEHIFEFSVPMAEKNEIKVVSGKLNDEAVIYHTDIERPEYKVTKSKQAANWV